MKELGFKEDAPDATKEAFIKHLISKLYDVEVETPSERSDKKKSEQLEFDFMEEKIRA